MAPRDAALRALGGSPTLDVAAAALLPVYLGPQLHSLLDGMRRYGVDYERAATTARSMAVRVLALAVLGVDPYTMRKIALSLASPLMDEDARLWALILGATPVQQLDGQNVRQLVTHFDGFATAESWRVANAVTFAALTWQGFPKDAVELAAIAAWNYQRFHGYHRAEAALFDALHAVHFEPI